MNKVHFSSASDQWSTPIDFFKKVEAEFGPFDLDPCADEGNSKAKFYWSSWSDGLAAHNTWYGKVFCNPPYGRQIGRWVERAWRSVYETGSAELVVLLLPARTDTKWFQDFCLWPEAAVRFIRGRLKFGGSKNSAPFPSALVIFRQTQK